MSLRKLHELSSDQLFSGAALIGPLPNSLHYNPLFGIGLTDGETYGYLITGIFQLDCSPTAVEYGEMTYERDVYYGWSDISWQVRSSSTGNSDEWSSWYDSLKEVPVRQFVQFKFEFFRNA